MKAKQQGSSNSTPTEETLQSTPQAAQEAGAAVCAHHPHVNQETLSADLYKHISLLAETEQHRTFIIQEETQAALKCSSGRSTLLHCLHYSVQRIRETRHPAAPGARARAELPRHPLSSSCKGRFIVSEQWLCGLLG